MPRPSATGVLVLLLGLVAPLLLTLAVPDRPAPPAAPAAAPAADDAVADRLRAATVRVHVGDGHGSGFARRLADGSVWVWTCGHVTRALPVPADGEPTPVTVSRLIAGRHEAAGRLTWAATVIHASDAPDVALLRLTGDPADGLAGLDFAAATPRPGDAVLACGCPYGLDGSVTRGRFVFAGRRSPALGLGDQIDAPIAPGSSGGPVADHAGRVVGLAQGGYSPAFGLVVPARAIRAWADAVGHRHAFDGSAAPTR